MNITVFRHTPSWRKARNEQQNYIRSQDYPTRRCVRLYEEADAFSQHSQSSMPSVNEHHVGVLYAPPFRPFMFGKVEDKSVLYDSASYSESAETPTGRYRGYSNPSSMTSLHPSVINDTYSESEDDQQSDYEAETIRYDTRSIRSGTSRDNESFHTAKDSEDEDEFSIADDYSIISEANSEFTSGDASSVEQSYYQHVDQPMNYSSNQSNLTSAIPPSIPYSDYLRRFKVQRLNSEYSHQGSFFHTFIPPSKPNFIPENVSKKQA